MLRLQMMLDQGQIGKMMDRILLRLERAERFINYLKEQEIEEANELAAIDAAIEFAAPAVSSATVELAVVVTAAELTAGVTAFELTATAIALELADVPEPPPPPQPTMANANTLISKYFFIVCALYCYL